MKPFTRPLQFAALALIVATAPAFAGGGAAVKLDPAPINLHDQASLQRGARNFVNYCLNCHSAQFMRYSALTGIGLTEKQIADNLIFTGAKPGDAMVSNLDPMDAKEWLKSVPPDLTLVARSRGSDWLYTFLRGFYRDDKSPSGWNNTVFKSTSMPHVLHDLQGTQAYVTVGERSGKDGKPEPVMKLAIERAGTMSEVDYNRFVADLVNFLTYMAEPSRTQRQQWGLWVLALLTLGFFVSLWLKHEYWKDVK
jgi:ubiquinol-cytochrome c reductase cytochrome c1 subunit